MCIFIFKQLFLGNTTIPVKTSNPENTTIPKNTTGPDNTTPSDITLTRLKMETCDDRMDLFNITEFSASPYPIDLNQVMTLKLSVEVLQKIDTSISANVTMEIQAGPFWFSVPCFGTTLGINVGSCYYSDICSLFLRDVCSLSGSDKCSSFRESCPSATENSIMNCETCPLSKGQFTFQELVDLRNIDRAFVVGGSYRYKIKFSNNNVNDCIVIFGEFA